MDPNSLSNLPVQTKLINSIKTIPVEYFQWGQYPDHFQIDMPHRHEFSELMFFTKGNGTHEIDYKEYSIQDRTIYFIPKASVHFLKWENKSEGFTIAFDSRYFEFNNTHKFVNPLKFEPFKLSLSESAFQQILDQTHLIHSQIKQRDGYFKQKRFLLSMELLLVSLAEEQQKNYLQKEEKELSHLIRSFKFLVDTNIHKQHQVAWYASQLNVNAKSLSNQVKNHFAVSAKQYLHQVLLISVKKSLFNSPKSFKEIAMDHNYDVSQLGKLFKKNVGYTPKEYRSYREKKK